MFKLNPTTGKLDLVHPKPNYLKVVNKTGADIPIFKVVYITGSQGNRPTIALADNTDADKLLVAGITTTAITDNNQGYIITFGELNRINATGTPVGEVWAEGDKLYLGTSGNLTKTHPTLATSGVIRVAEVLNAHATQGAILLNEDAFTIGNNFAGTLRQSIINKNALGATGFTAVNDQNHYMTTGIGGSNNAVVAFRNSCIFYGMGYGDNLYAVDGAKSHKWYNDPTDAHNNTSLSYLNMELDKDGILYTKSIIPFLDSTSDIGSSTPKYFANAYIDKVYTNSGAYIDGTARANTTTIIGTATLGASEILNLKANQWDVKSRFLSYGGTGTLAPAYYQMQWSCNVASDTNAYLDVNTLPAMQMILGLGSGYENGAFVISYRAPTATPTTTSHYHDLFKAAYAGTVIDGAVSDSQTDAPSPTARLDVYTRVAAKPALNLRAFTAQSADMMRIYDAAAATGTTYSTKFNAVGRLGIGRGTSALVAQLETQSTGTTNEAFNMINHGSDYWAGFANRTSGTEAYSTEINSFVTLERSRGTTSSPSQTLKGDLLGAIIWGGYGTSAWNRQGAKIRGYATDNYTSTTLGTKLTFETTTNGTATPTERAYIDHDGSFEIYKLGQLYYEDECVSYDDEAVFYF